MMTARMSQMPFSRPRRGSLVLLAFALVAALTGSMASAPDASADAGCPAGTAMNIVAHQDDDLLFQSPGLLSAIRDGLCVRTVYLTAGDANDSEAYWSAREDGVKAAYAHLAGVADAWTTADAGIAEHPIPVATLDGATKLSLAFMRLPDGHRDGRGGSDYGYESLQKLYSGAISTITAVNDSSSYTLPELRGTLLALMNSYQPDQISTLDFAGTFGDGDHSDHHTVAYLVLAAQQLYTLPHTITGYQGYPISQRPANVVDPDLTAKTDAFLAYAQHDSKTCTTALDCSNNSVGNWLSRSYTVPPTAVAPVAGAESTNIEGDPANVAASASVTASSQNTASGQTAVKAVDGVIAGHPVDATREWATVGGRAGSYLDLAFPAAVTLNRVVLYDRPNASDQITGGSLSFSDGTTVSVPALDNAGQATSISFPDTATTNLRLTVTTVSGTTRNVGLAELRAYLGTEAPAPTAPLTEAPAPVTEAPGPAVPGTEAANVASSAAVTASSQNTASGQTAVKAVDGVIAGHPVDATREWATVGGRAGSYLDLAFPTAVTLNRVVLYDRPNSKDQITGGTLSFSDGTTVPVPTLDNAGQATSVSFPDTSTTSLRLTVTTVSGTTRNVGLAELQAYTGTGAPAPTAPDAANIAALASVTASSQNDAAGQTAVKAIDGVIAGYPVDSTREWATVGGRAGSYLDLAFPATVTLNRVVLYDRPNAKDQITGGTLTFSDGSTVAVPALDNAGQATSISFPDTVTTSLRLTVTTVSGTTRNVGLAELQAYLN
ncbi:PIG-L family deacetylase [Arthrobacter sp. UYEF36]|uniref:PIG-L family deacetylase n=1 Tax=Arthrobacter sp. UYEF36 TaxID=1756366 RepID=UPI003396465E